MNPEHKTLSNWHDLEQYGIISLTGEACGTSQRLLCDLTPEGVDFIQSFLSIQMEVGSNINRSQGQVASIMLPHSIMIDLLVYGLLQEGYEAVIHVIGDGRYRGRNVTGMSQQAWEERREIWHEAHAGHFRYYCRSTAPGTGLLNRHAMSGRIG